VFVPDDDSILELNELFPNCATGNQVIVSDKADFDLLQIFEEQTRFSYAVSESLAEFVNSACTKQADVAAFIEASQIPSNCKSLGPPLIIVLIIIEFIRLLLTFISTFLILNFQYINTTGLARTCK
jgi:hypothetical protein